MEYLKNSYKLFKLKNEKGANMTKKEIAKYIDHTNLSQTATKEDIAKLCEEAYKNNFHSVCVNPKYVEFAKQCMLDLGSDVKICTVIGYPLGESTQEIKAMEAVMAKEGGADELDVVVSISAAVTANFEYIYEEIRRIVDCCEIPVKAIVETSKLTNDQLIKVCEACIDAGVKFVVANTGYVDKYVALETIKLMSDTVAGVCEVKSCGAVDNIDMLYDLVCAGATRLGVDNGIAILDGFGKKNK